MTAPAPPVQISHPPDSPKRVFSHLAPAELLALVLTEGLTSAERRRLIAPHVGHWLAIEGTVNNVDDTYPTFVQVLINAGLGAQIIATFTTNLEEAAALRKGMPVHIVGKIEGPTATEYSFVLGDCEFRR
jgi:hypothetical protein